MKSEILIAFRFLRGSRTEKNISFMIKVCFFSILLGTSALTLVAAIMSGFEKATYEKLKGLHSDIVMRSDNGPINFEKVKQTLEREISNVSSFSPNGITQVILQTQKQDATFQIAVLLKGIEPNSEQNVNKLPQMVLDKKNKLSDLLKENQIIIGKKLAEKLKIKITDNVKLLFTSDVSSNNNQINLDSQNATVSAFFNTGIDEFDEHVIFCNLELFNEISQSGITEINIKLKDLAKERETIENLKKRFSLPVLSWKELYPALVSSLILEKYVMFIIFFLMTLVTCINSIALIFMFITHKQNDIALLKSFGVSDNKLIRIFMILGSIITIGGGITGLAIALIIGKFLQYWPIALPSVYYIDYLPVNINLFLILIILSIVILISLLNLIIPIKRIKKIPAILALKKYTN